MIKKAMLFTVGLMAISLWAVSQTVVEAPLQPADSINKIYTFVNEEAQFPGGFAAWKKYLEANLKTDVPIKNGAADGMYTVMITFVVNKDGMVTDIKQLSNRGYGMENEAISIIRKGPLWLPALRYGRRVNSLKRQAFTFVIKTT